MSSLASYDTEVVRDALTVPEVLDALGVDADLDEHGRGFCPFCGAQHERSFAVFADGSRYQCHRASCLVEGSIFDAIMALRDVNFTTARAWAAELADVAPDARIDPVERQRRAAEHAKRVAAASAKRRLAADVAGKRAADRWFDLHLAWIGQRDTEAQQLVRGYLRTRGAESVVGNAGDPRLRGLVVGRIHRPTGAARADYAAALLEDPWLALEAHGAVCVALVALDADAVVNIVERRFVASWHDREVGYLYSTPTQKIGSRFGCTTEGTFGRPSDIAPGRRIVITEGVFDFLVAHLEPQWRDAAILGAHGAARIPWLVTSLLDHHNHGPITRATSIVFVTHRDDAGRANVELARREALARGMKAAQLVEANVAPYGDLAERHEARARATA